DHHHQRGAGELRIEPQVRDVARLVGRLVERDLQLVRRVAAGGRVVVAGIEVVARRGRTVGRGHLEQVVAVVDGRCDGRGAGCECIDGAVGDLAGGGDLFPLPGAVVAVPLVRGVELAQRPDEAGPGGELAVGADVDHVEAGLAARLQVVPGGKLRLDADAVGGGRDRAGERALDGTAVGVDEA